MLNALALFFVSGLAVGSLYALGGVGLVILFRSTGVLNFSYGAIAAFSAMFAWQLIQWGFTAPLAWIGAILAGISSSVVYGRLVSPRFAWREPTVKAISTLGYILILIGLMDFIWEDTLRKIELPTDKIGVLLLGVRITVTRIVAFVGTISAVYGMTEFLGRTRVGLNMRALSDNRNHAALLGIPVVKTETLAWGISGALAGFTGLLFANLVRLEPNVITFMVIPAIAAAICGKLESLSMTFVGGLVIGVTEALLTVYKPLAPLRSMVPFVAAGLAILWLQRNSRLIFATGD